VRDLDATPMRVSREISDATEAPLAKPVPQDSE
jgi:hypothetical protein